MLRTILSFAAAVAIAGAASAQGNLPSINIDIGSLGYGAGTPASSFGGAGPVGTWNELDVDVADAAGTVYTTPALLDTSGASTGVTLEWDSLGGGFLPVFWDEPSTFADDAALLDDCGYVGGPSDFRVMGLPAGTYDVITYAMAPDSPAYFTSVNVVGSFDPAQDIGGDFSLGYALGTTHALHTVTLGAGGVLTIQTDVAASFDSIAGIQIFESGSGPGGPSVGTVFCDPAIVNSSGAAATMSATGSAIVANNALTLQCSNMPIQAFGFFLVSTVQDSVPNPGGSQGVLCLGGAIGRYVGPGEIINSGIGGEIQLALDLTAIPQPTGFVAVQPGDVWYFTTWFRDSVGGNATSNFSDGLCVTFN